MYFNDLFISMFEIGPLKILKLSVSQNFKYSKDMTSFHQLPIYIWTQSGYKNVIMLYGLNVWKSWHIKKLFILNI
jgi:hypothetical protein